MSLMQDIRQASRSLARRPHLLAVGCGALALGIGATTAVFSMVDAVLLAPLPYGETDELVVVRSIDGEGEEQPLAREAKETLARSASAFASIAGYGFGSWVMSGTGDAEEVSVVTAEHHIFDLLRVRPAMGALFTEDHRAEGGDGHVIVLSWKLWQRRFGGDPDVIDRTVDLREVPHRIIGVMPAGFEFPVGSEAEAWVPLIYAPIDDLLRFVPVQNAVARLTHGTDPVVASTEASGVVARVAAEGTDPWGEPVMTNDRPWSALVIPVREAMLVSDRSLVLIFAAVGLLLLIACANVANLFLVHTAERRHELAVRAAIGGGRWRVARPLVIEVAVVCFVAGAVALFLAQWAIDVLVALDPGGLPRWDGIRLNGRVWLAATLATALAACVAGVAPALAAARAAPGEAMESGARGTDPRGRLRVREVIIGVELGLVFVLLVGSGLLLRSFAAVRGVDPGYRMDSVVTARVVLPVSRYERARNAPQQFYDDVLDRLRAHPDVDAAGAVSAAPMSDGGTEIAGPVTSPVTGRIAYDARLLFATPDYFRTLGVPVRGREFTAVDRSGAQRVAIVNESMARHLFPDDDALGRRFATGPGEVEVVGVVPDLRTHGPERVPPRTYYVPHAQFQFLPGMVIAVHASGDGATLARTLVETIRAIDPQLPVADVRTLAENRSRVMARRRFDLVMLAGTAAAALILAMAGVFAVTGHAVAQRTREFGIRQALGAHAADILTLVLRRIARITLAALAASALLAVIFAHALRAMLFGVQPIDGPSFAFAALVLAAVSLFAASAPALRASRMSPVDALRDGG